MTNPTPRASNPTLNELNALIDSLDEHVSIENVGAALVRLRDQLRAASQETPIEAGDYTDTVARLTASIRLGIIAEDPWDGPSIKEGELSDEQINWLASWLAGDGVTKP